MTDKPDWRPQPLREEVQLGLPLSFPQSKRITQYRADVCPICGSVHTTRRESVQCYESNAREQR